MNHETLWAREGDVMVLCQRYGAWSLFASNRPAYMRSDARRELHGYDFRVESKNGTKRMVKVRKKKEAS